MDCLGLSKVFFYVSHQAKLGVLPGRLVLSVSLIINTSLSGSSCIKGVFSFAIVWFVVK